MLSALILALAPQSSPKDIVPDNVGYYMQPSLRGDTLVFVSQSRIWRVAAQGGHAQALTSAGAPASYPQISPDGTLLAFSGTYEGSREAYVMPIEGGAPKRLTLYGDAIPVGWKAQDDLLVETHRFSTLPNPQLVNVNPATVAAKLEPLAQASNGAYNPDTRALFFTRLAFQGSSTKRYQGGEVQNIWKYVDGAPEAKPLTASYAGTTKDPMLWNGRVYFLSDRDGTMNLWSMKEDGEDQKQLTHSSGWDIQSASLDNGRIAYQAGADIHIYNVAKAADRVVPITLDGDFDQTLQRWVSNPTAWISSVDFAADGSKLAITARGQVFVMPVDPGRIVDATRKPGIRFREARLLPEGKSVVTLSDESGETEWWKYPANGVGPGEQITSGSTVLGVEGVVSPDSKHLVYVDKAQNVWLVELGSKSKQKIYSCPDGQPNSFKWSPDNQWIAFVFPTQKFDRIALYSLKTGKTTPITTERSDAERPAWTPDGKWLYFISQRTFNTVVNSPWGNRQPEAYFPNEGKIYYLALQPGLRSPFLPNDEAYTPPGAPKPDGSKPLTLDVQLDGLTSRLYEAPVPAGEYDLLTTNGERLFFVGGGPGQPRNLMAMEIKNKNPEARTLVENINGYDLSQDGKKLLINRAGRFYVQEASFQGGPLTNPIDMSGWRLTVEPRLEWRQMFVEAWRLHRDYFYDPGMHGVDWKAVLTRYLPLVDRVRDRSELNNLIAQMVGELSTLHTFVVGGDTQRPVNNVTAANLGAEWVSDPGAGGFKITRVYRGDPDYPDEISPLSRPEVAVVAGDVIQSVDGVSVLSVPDPNSLLREKVGQEVLLHVKTGDGKERDCIARPIGSGTFQDLRYSDWEISRRNVVDQASGNKIGYIHLRAMGAGDMDRWERDFYPVFDREGLIIDVRNNGGGNIDSWILEKLLRKPWFYWQPRIGPPQWNMQEAFRGHVVVLCNAGTASDGEAFTEGIKRLKIGTVIGTRTWGGEVWLGFDNTLVDKGIASAAELGVYGPEGKWLIEGHGVDPDIEVDDLPHSTYLGKDAQLEAGIAYLLKEIKDHPVPVPPTPKYPNKAFPYKSPALSDGKKSPGER